ncbi:wax ester/triacylglycerol synthase family O-acyltransferase [Marmoricola sp. Leaf446]|uniref:WS/DGAT/MGAT family O-acyltransferase n=1 Tax=Marmoricola sp. Leaf446 TaxID=1736379 RepID=UPI0009EC7F9A|nr:wax ester/triacylglycerol synthase family O-acyltransferase [Marmoricola sp. Leaf446]
MAKKRRVPPQDAMFLWIETPETMMHVASLMPFTPPADAGPTYLRDILEEARHQPVLPPWNQKLTHPFLLRHPRQAWVEDENFDFDFHVRRSALASPGDERELGILVSRLHSHQLDFTRPPWELHVIEGLEGGRFALYTKVHHALVDGYSAVKMLGRSLSEDPDSKGKFFFSLDPPKRSKPPKESASLVRAVTGTATGVAKGALGAAGSAAGVAKAVIKLETSRGEEHKNLKGGWSAPDSIFNQRTSRTRRFATQQFDTSRFKAVAKASGGTLNDVVMAVCGGGLRAYLDELGELPTKPLVAFVPVNIRDDGDEGGGNKVAVLMASMGTHVADPVERLEAVIDSTTKAKDQMAGLGQLPSLAYSGYLLAPSVAQTSAAIAGVKNPLPNTFNLVLSNVPGPKKTLWLHGSRLEAVYPVSIPAHGMALNITLETYADTMNFGFIGDRDAVPHLQRLAVYTGEALTALEKGLGLPSGGDDSGSSDASDKPTQKARSGRSAATRAALDKPAKKAAAKKAPPRKTATKKAPAKKSTAKNAPAKKTSN